MEKLLHIHAPSEFYREKIWSTKILNPKGTPHKLTPPPHTKGAH